MPFSAQLTLALFVLCVQIDSDPDSDTYGQLLVNDMNDIDVFDARNKLNQKMAEIERLAQLPEEDEDYEDNCNALLSELVTACGDGSCSNPNQYSFQLSVTEVCQAVDTPIKFGIEQMVRRKALFFYRECINDYHSRVGFTIFATGHIMEAVYNIIIVV